MQLRPPNESERAGIRALLAGNDLPIQDLDTATIDFTVAVEDGRIVGVVGLEILADAGLVRSLAVEATHRGSGTGAALVLAVEAQARQRNLSQLVLLTQTAETFFARRGYGVIPRSSAPASVQTSGEFRSICPASATCMSKFLIL
ncbi:arsenic resistance N-acetyltransferase ArsN2 [Lysobacter tyrosinilyticus]